MSEHESAFAAWLDSPETKREMEIIKRRYHNISGELPTLFETLQLALQMEILVSLNAYIDPGDDPDPPPPPEAPALPDPPVKWEDSDGDESWKEDRDD